jgi:chemotaxis protein MotA
VDIASICGIILALLGILLGLTREGGSVAQLTQPTAALIVLGGTGGAVLLQFPLGVLLAAVRAIRTVFAQDSGAGDAVLRRLIEFAHKARKNGIISLDAELRTVEDPFLRRTLMLAVDGVEPTEMRRIMQLELENQVETQEKVTTVFEAAGGYSPTVGIIGAVLGLIQVMQHLDNISEVGRGIAVAFVATIYGVGLANLVCLPIAGKLKIRYREEQVVKEMILEGVVSILEGMNPRMLEMKLRTFLDVEQPRELQETMA